MWANKGVEGGTNVVQQTILEADPRFIAARYLMLSHTNPALEFLLAPHKHRHPMKPILATNFKNTCMNLKLTPIIGGVYSILGHSQKHCVAIHV